MRYLDRVHLVFDNRTTATAAEVSAVAARLGVTFPDGYTEYVTELGKGTLSTYFRLWLPQEVETELAELRLMLCRSSFWDQDGPLTPARLQESIILGDTMDGDYLVFHPDRPDDLFVLPRNDEQIYQLGPGLDAAIDWLCDSGILTRPMTCRYFEPDGERESIQRLIPLPFQAVRDALVELEIHDQIAYEEHPEDEEQVFEIFVENEDGELEEADAEAGIMLLVQEFGGDVSASTDISSPGSTEVTITHVPGLASPKMERLLGLLDELENE